VKRLAEFVRSVIPADPFQLFFLGGSLLLFICMQLRCYPVAPGHRPDVSDFLRGNYDEPIAKIRLSWLMFSFWARLPVFFAGAAGLFVCFWPGKHPVRRTLIFICLPAIAGIGALCARFLYLGADLTSPLGSVLERSQHNETWGIKTLWSMGPALHMGLLGIALVLVFVSRMAMGIASLPLSLAEPVSAERPRQYDEWKRILTFIWISIAGISVIGFAAAILVQGIYRLLFAFVDYHRSPDSVSLTSALATAMLAGVAAWAAGESRWRELKRFTHLPEIPFAMLGALIPIVINSASSIWGYLKDRVHWAGFDFGRFGPPLLSTYFEFPQALFFWYLPAAVFEEIIWRGYLQPRFIRRFGVIRGIFLLGLVWSAFHFMGDFQKTSEDYQVLLKLGLRLFSCVVLGYVLGWLALRSGSVWPAALAHGFDNVWVISGSGWLREQDSWLLKIIPWGFWVLLAVMLFRFWPPIVADDIPADSEPTQTEPPTTTETAS
jgi:membrane protease YdiL (CAAX protease family)